MNTLKSHTEQVIQKFREKVTELRNADHESEEPVEFGYKCAVKVEGESGKTVYKVVDFGHIEAFIVTALKELSDLQAEETRVGKKDHTTEEGKRKNENHQKDELWCCIECVEDDWANKAIKKQEKLSNAFRNI